MPNNTKDHTRKAETASPTTSVASSKMAAKLGSLLRRTQNNNLAFTPPTHSHVSQVTEIQIHKVKQNLKRKAVASV
jgi:hypothetical protein